MRDDLKVSFIIPGYKCDEFIERNLSSILDQDYKNWEAIVVLNGTWDTKEELHKSLTTKYGIDKIKVISIKESGLGNANNVGFNESTGDIISHLSSDLYLMPGALRTWVEILSEHPEYGFAYSGYRFVSNDPTQIYYSDKFNRHHLECENFIDGANPVRRKNWKEWNKSLKSLVDWDFFLSVTDDGTKGYYIKEPLYFAELPKEGGLSHDSNDNWIKRTNEIKKLHNIPSRDICMASLTQPDYALKTAEMLDVDYKMHPAFKPHEYRLIYLWEFDCTDMNIQRNTGMFFNHYGHKIIHWTGKDIRSLCNMRWVDVDLYAQMVMKKIDNHFCLTRNDQKVLSRIGVEAQIIYPPIRMAEVTEKKDKVISCNKPDLVDQLKKAMPDFEFAVNDLSCPITVHFEDDVERIIESVCNGNTVITNTDVPGVRLIQGFTNVPELRKMIVHQVRNSIRYIKDIEQDVINDYKTQTSHKNFLNKLRKIADKQIYKYGKLEDIEVNQAQA